MCVYSKDSGDDGGRLDMKFYIVLVIPHCMHIHTQSAIKGAVVYVLICILLCVAGLQNAGCGDKRGIELPSVIYPPSSRSNPAALRFHLSSLFSPISSIISPFSSLVPSPSDLPHSVILSPLFYLHFSPFSPLSSLPSHLFLTSHIFALCHTTNRLLHLVISPYPLPSIFSPTSLV